MNESSASPDVQRKKLLLRKLILMKRLRQKLHTEKEMKIDPRLIP